MDMHNDNGNMTSPATDMQNVDKTTRENMDAKHAEEDEIQKESKAKTPMRKTTLGTTSGAPSTSTQTLDRTTELFRKHRQIVTCPKCNTRGMLKLNGATKLGKTVVCAACNKKTGGQTLRDWLDDIHNKDKDTQAPAPKRTRPNEDAAANAISHNNQLDHAAITKVVNRLATMENMILDMSRRYRSEAQHKRNMEGNIRRLSDIIQTQTTTIRQLQQQVQQMAQEDNQKQHAPNTKGNAHKMQQLQQNNAMDIEANHNTPAMTKPQGETNKSQWTTVKYTKGNTTNRPTTQSTPKTWAEIARTPRMESLAPAMQDRVEKTKQSLQDSGFAPTTQIRKKEENSSRPIPTAVYFAGVPRGRISVFRKALMQQHALPGWAILSLSFIGQSIVEIITHKPLHDRLTSVMSMCGYRLLKHYDPTKGRAMDAANSQEGIAPTNATACMYRWTNCMQSARPGAAKTWYKEQVERLTCKYPDMAANVNNSQRLKANRDGTDTQHGEGNTGAAIRMGSNTDQLEGDTNTTATPDKNRKVITKNIVIATMPEKPTDEPHTGNDNNRMNIDSIEKTDRQQPKTGKTGTETIPNTSTTITPVNVNEQATSLPTMSNEEKNGKKEKHDQQKGCDQQKENTRINTRTMARHPQTVNTPPTTNTNRIVEYVEDAKELAQMLTPGHNQNTKDITRAQKHQPKNGNNQQTEHNTTKEQQVERRETYPNTMQNTNKLMKECQHTGHDRAKKKKRQPNTDNMNIDNEENEKDPDWHESDNSDANSNMSLDSTATDERSHENNEPLIRNGTKLAAKRANTNKTTTQSATTQEDKNNTSITDNTQLENNERPLRMTRSKARNQQYTPKSKP